MEFRANEQNSSPVHRYITRNAGVFQDGNNNPFQNAIRPSAVGKKNWLFVGEAGAGQRGAIIYTIIESCRRRSIDPYTYLRDLLTRLPHLTNHQISEVTPAAWAKDHKSSKAKS